MANPTSRIIKALIPDRGPCCLRYRESFLCRQCDCFLTKLLRVSPVVHPFRIHTSALVSYLNIGVHFFQPITREIGADFLDKLNATMIQRHHVKRLECLGFKVTIEPLTKAA